MHFLGTNKIQIGDVDPFTAWSRKADPHAVAVIELAPDSLQTLATFETSSPLEVDHRTRATTTHLVGRAVLSRFPVAELFFELLRRFPWPGQPREIDPAPSHPRSGDPI